MAVNWGACGRKRPWPNLGQHPGICLEGLGKTTKSLNLDSRCPGVVPPEYKLDETLPLEPLCPCRYECHKYVCKGNMFVCNYTRNNSSSGKTARIYLGGWLFETLPEYPVSWITLGALMKMHYVWIEVLTAVVLKSSVFWDIMPSSPFKVNRRFGGTYHLHFKGRRISPARKQRESIVMIMYVYIRAYVFLTA
jgi:hypothetical protein